MPGKLNVSRVTKNKSLAELIDGGRRLSSVQTVAFTLLFRDFEIRCQQPWTLTCQRFAEPFYLQWEHQRFVDTLKNAQSDDVLAVALASTSTLDGTVLHHG